MCIFRDKGRFRNVPEARPLTGFRAFRLEVRNGVVSLHSPTYSGGSDSFPAKKNHAGGTGYKAAGTIKSEFVERVRDSYDYHRCKTCKQSVYKRVKKKVKEWKRATAGFYVFQTYQQAVGYSRPRTQGDGYWGGTFMATVVAEVQCWGETQIHNSPKGYRTRNICIMEIWVDTATFDKYADQIAKAYQVKVNEVKEPKRKLFGS